MRLISVRIEKGKVRFDFSGYRGELCVKEAEKLKRILAEKYGVNISQVEIHYKPEYYEVTEEIGQREEETW